MKSWFLLGLWLGATGLIACAQGVSSPQVKPRGDRVLSISVTEAADGDYEKAFKTALQAGMQATTLSLQWDEVEKTRGDYASPWPKIADLFYSAYHVRLDLMFNAIDTNNLRVPKHLAGKSFDSPEVLDAYCQALEWVLQQMPHVQLGSVSIGNEVDGWLGEDPARWRAYTTFYEAVSARLKARHPGLKVCVKVMFEGLGADATRDLAKRLNAKSDVISVSYYPLEGSFQVKPPDCVKADFATLVKLYPKRPIYLAEIGYPSGALTGSSGARQAAFVREAFKAWDEYADHIKLLNFVWLTDISPQAVADYGKYYGLKDPSFLSYLATLGLCASDGTAKPAFEELCKQAHLRGWRLPPE